MAARPAMDVSRSVRGLGPAGPAGWLHAAGDERAVRPARRGRAAVGGGQAAPAGLLQAPPADGQPACRAARAAAISRAEHDGGQHPRRHGWPPSARAAEPFLPTRVARARPDESTGPPVLRASPSIVPAPAAKRRPWRGPAGTGVPAGVRSRQPPGARSAPARVLKA